MKAGQQDSNNGHWTTVAELLHVIIHYYLLQPTITTTINFQKGKKKYLLNARGACFNYKSLKIVIIQINLYLLKNLSART